MMSVDVLVQSDNAVLHITTEGQHSTALKQQCTRFYLEPYWLEGNLWLKSKEQCPKTAEEGDESGTSNHEDETTSLNNPLFHQVQRESSFPQDHKEDDHLRNAVKSC
ncbi:hypothetical protein AOLI_G00039490 [Acnodon oligacanthus]